MALRPPPSLHKYSDRPPGYIFEVITKGFGLMASYAAEMTIEELSAADLHVGGAGDSGPRLDARARAAYKQRLKDLEAELEDAERVHDAERVDRLGAEIEFIRGELSAAYGLGGRIRQLAGSHEQARKNVTNAIRYTLARIEKVHPALGRHLRSAIKTGLFCSYRPEHLTAWDA